MIPSANTVKRDKAPPENMLNMPRMPPSFCLNSAARATGSIPGTGMCAPIRYTTNAPSKNQSRPQGNPAAALLPSCELVANFCSDQAVCQLGYRATSCFDGRFRARRCLDAFEVHRLGDFAGQDDAHIARQHWQDACLLEHQDVDIADGQVVQVRQTHFSLERGVQGLEAALRQTALQRHLTAFEADFMKAARTRFLTLVTTAGRFAQAGADTAADATLGVLGAFGWLNGIEFHVFLRSQA